MAENTDTPIDPPSLAEQDYIARGFQVARAGKMVPDGLGGLVEQVVVTPPPSERDLWPYYTPRPAPEVATIYFIGPENGPIKIGYATRLEVRLRDLQLANAYPVRVWASVEGSPSLERDYHKRFAAHRLHGEWFERCPEIEAEIERLSA